MSGPIRVRAPATLSNLGPGFDVLGVAVDLWNHFTISFGGAAVPTAPGDTAILDAARAVAARAGQTPPGSVHVTQIEGVPRSRGLGSSATARVAGALAWRAWASAPLADLELLEVLTELEGHPDNVCAGLLGGAVISTGERPLHVIRYAPPPGLVVALVIPERQVATADARAVLPDRYTRADVVFNSRRLAFLLHGLRSGDADALRVGMDDRIHHPYRAPLIGPVDEALRAALAAGAATAFISGSGSTLAALVPPQQAHSAAAGMAQVLRDAGVVCQATVVRMIDEGAVVEAITGA